MILDSLDLHVFSKFIFTLYLLDRLNFLFMLNFIDLLQSNFILLAFTLHIHHNWLNPIDDFILILRGTLFLVP